MGKPEAAGRARSGATTLVHIVCLQSPIPLRTRAAGSRIRERGRREHPSLHEGVRLGRDVEEQVESRRRCHRQFEVVRYDFRE